MRCPFCFAEVGEKPAICPNCHETLTRADGTLRTEADLGSAPERYHVWIPLGNLVSLGVGGLLFYLGIEGLGILGTGAGVVLIGLAALSLLISRGGTQWDDLSRGQRTVVWAGVTGVIGLLALTYAWSSLEEIPHESVAQNYLRTKYPEQYYPGPLPKMPAAADDEQEDHQSHLHEPSV
ncbi:MAG TPA: hypothetical protein VH590_21840 [Ktedonobacterales bacterium]|jgi:hypothetical protein